MELTWTGGGGTSGSNYTKSNVFTELTGNFTFNNDDIRAVYIDWGDGQDPSGNFTNEKDYANYQWYTTTEPESAIKVTHLYTATGSFDPVVQTVNSDGFFSGYQKRGTASTQVSPSYIAQGTTISGMAVYDSTATGVLRVENKTVKSGIDNSIFDKEGPKDLYLVIPPLCTTAQLTTINSITIEIEAVVDTSMISVTDATVVGGSGKSVQTLTPTALSSLTSKNGLTAVDITGGQVSKILKVTYKNPKYTTDATDYSSNAAYQNLKIFLVVQGDDGNYYPITYVSAGSPIKKADDPLRNITLDFSQSRTKASNTSISYYRYDNGKVWFNPANQWVVSGAAGSEIFGDQTKQAGETKTVAYTYSNVRPDGLNGQSTVAADGAVGITISALAFDSTASAISSWEFDNSSKDQTYRIDQFVVDEFGRFTDQYHLTRMSADPDTTDSGSTSNVSSIINNQPKVFRMTPALMSTMSLATSGSATKFDIAPTASGNFTSAYTDEAVGNYVSSTTTNMVSLSGMNTQTWSNITGSSRSDNEYMILLFSEKTNQVGFNLNNYANSLITKNLSGASFTTPWEINGVSYLAIDESGNQKQNAHWEPVEYNDTTKATMEYRDTSNDKYTIQGNSLSQSGYLSFDMPLDWTAVSLENLCGGQFDGTTTATSTDWDIKVTGNTITKVSDTASASFGGVLKVDVLTGDSLSTLGTADDIGAFKYIAVVLNPGGAANIDNKPLWVASGTSNGTNTVLDDLYLTYGEDIGTDYVPTNLVGATNVIFKIRRVNIYDVLTGVSKVEKQGSSAVKLAPVDAEISDFPCKYGVSDTSAGFGLALKSAWSGSSLYALRVSLSGSGNGAAPYSADADKSNIFPEIWNIFDGNRGYQELIKEIDDSAYNLNALPVTSDVSVSRVGAYYTAITRKGKVFISRTGDSISSIGFSSVGLGDGTFDTFSAPGTLYGQLRKIRGLQANSVRVYWDELQKDGTYVRYWGVIRSVNETHGTGGSRSVIHYNFDMIVEEIALLDTSGILMTDIVPLGGIGDEKIFT